MIRWALRVGEQHSTFLVMNRQESFDEQILPGKRVLWLVDDTVRRLHTTRVKHLINQSEPLGEPISVRVSEKIKCQEYLAKLYKLFAARNLTRCDAIGVIGGGALSDIGGYAAATWMRGIPWAVVPTTLLAMVDASIGGKTGLNLSSGKNQIGAIWQPSQIIVDPEFQETLSATEFRSGMGEIVKYGGLLGGKFLVSLIRESATTKNSRSSKIVNDQTIVACMRYKSNVVRKDFRELGKRRVLNLGHTFAHGIEAALGYGKLTHGEAVLIGLLAANRLSVLAGNSTNARLESYDQLVLGHARMIHLPPISVPKVVRAMQSDKKRERDGLRFVLLRRPGEPIISAMIPKPLVTLSLQQALVDLSNERKKAI